MILTLNTLVWILVQLRGGQSHENRINRQLRCQKWTPRSLLQYLRNQIQFSHQGYLLFDDTVFYKRHSHFIEMELRHWSGNTHAVIPGIGVVTCVYVNPELQRFWVLDFRLFDPERDGHSKIDHLLEMFDRVRAKAVLRRSGSS